MHNTKLKAEVVFVDWCVAETTYDTDTVYLPNQCAAMHAVFVGWQLARLHAAVAKAFSVYQLLVCQPMSSGFKCIVQMSA